MRTLVATAIALMASPSFAQSGATAESTAATNGNALEDKPSVDVTLREAYKREFAFLAGQKRQLTARLGRVVKTSAQESRTLQSDIDGLEAKLLRLEDQSKGLAEAFEIAQGAQQSSEDDKQLVDATIDQSKATLKDYGFESVKKEETDKAATIETNFRQAIDLLKKLSSVHKEQGEFFLQDGAKASGTIVRVGRIGAYGVSDAGAGVLAPAGGGKLKVWREAAPDDAKAIAQGDVGDVVSIFLYESLDARVDDSAEETPLQHVDSGGAIAWVIVGLGLFGLLLAAVRALLLMSASSNTDKLEQSVGESVRQNRLDDAIEACRRAKGSAARVLSSVLDSLKSGQEDIDDVVSEGLLKENRNLHRFNTIILVIAGVAPLLGLLGTVTGMISTFDVITKFGTGDPKLLSGGISTALVTTELGLIVAIPTLLLGNLLKGWGNSIENEVDRIVLRVVNIHKDVRDARAEEA